MEERSYLREAFEIAAGISTLLPERGHIEALIALLEETGILAEGTHPFNVAKELV